MRSSDTTAVPTNPGNHSSPQVSLVLWLREPCVHRAPFKIGSRLLGVYLCALALVNSWKTIMPWGLTINSFPTAELTLWAAGTCWSCSIPCLQTSGIPSQLFPVFVLLTSWNTVMWGGLAFKWLVMMSHKKGANIQNLFLQIVAMLSLLARHIIPHLSPAFHVIVFPSPL